MRRRPVARSGVALTLRRRPRLRNGLVVAIAVLCGAAVAMTVQAADRTRAAWGSAVSVLVVTDDLAAGDRLDPANTKVVGRPEPLVPDGALTEPSRRRSGRGRDVRRRGGPGGAAGPDRCLGPDRPPPARVTRDGHPGGAGHDAPRRRR